MAERAQNFLQLFWDLASPQKSTRTAAGSGIVRHLLAQQSALTGPKGALAEDTNYALKRLVRGVTSSRDAARQGFAACLTELLLALPEIETRAVMEMLEETTRDTGSMKGQEERDLMLGRVFGSLVLLQAKRLENLESLEQVFEWMMTLSEKKNWLQEVCYDGLLQLLSTSKDADARALVAKLQPLVEGKTTQELSPEQLMLILGLKRIAVNKKALAKAARGFLPAEDILSSSNIEQLSDMFKRSSAGFPKVHRMWDYVLAEVFLAPGQSIAEIGAGRASELPQEKLELLDTLAAFVDNDFANATHEKKGLAMRLVVMMLRMAPPTTISLVVRRNLLRSIMNAAGNKANHLHELSLQVLQDMVAAVSDEPKCGLELASVFMKEGDLNFDRRTGTSTVVSLVQGMDKQTMMEQIQLLEQVLASKPVATDKKHAAASKQDDEDADSEDEEATEEASALQRHLTAMDTLINIVRNPAVKHKWELVDHVATLLLTLAYADLDSCRSAIESSSGTTSKKSKTPKKRSKAKATTAMGENVQHAVTFVAGMESIHDELRAGAVKRLHTLLADLGHLSESQMQGEKDRDSRSEGGQVMHVVLLQRLREMMDAGVKFADQAGDANEELVELVQSVVAAVDLLNSSEDKRFASAAIGLLIQALFHAASNSLFPSEDETIDAASTVSTLCEYIAPLIHLVTTGKQEPEGEDEDDDDDDDEDVGAVIAGLTLDLLASDSELSTRGIRDAARKFWTALAIKRVVSEDAVQTFMLTVAGGTTEQEEGSDHDGDGDGDGDDEHDQSDDEASDAEEKDSEEDDEEEEEDDDEDSESADDEEAEEEEDTVTPAQQQDDGEEEDILLNDADLMKVLEEDDDLDPSVLVHTEEADGALGKMLKLKQMSRKAGLLQAKRQEYKLRLRSLDLLEAVVQKEDRRSILLSMFEPLCKALQTLAKSNVAKTVPEGSALQEKLRSFINNKLCRRNPPKQVAGDEVDAEAFQEMLVDLLVLRAKATTPLISEALLNCIGASCRLALNISSEDEHAEELKQALTEVIRHYLADYMQKRNRKVQSDVFDELINRFPAFWVENFMGDLLESASSAPNMYLKSESFRYLNLLYSKRKSLEKPVQQTLTDAVPQAVAALVALAEQKEENNTKQVNKAKRLKPILQFAMALAQTATSTDAEGSGLAKAREQLQTFAQTIAADNQSPVLRQLCNRIEAVISKSSGSEAGGKKQKPQKQQKQKQEPKAQQKKQQQGEQPAAKDKGQKKQDAATPTRGAAKKKRPLQVEETKVDAAADGVAAAPEEAAVATEPKSNKKKREKKNDEEAAAPVKAKRSAAALQSDAPASEEPKKKKKAKKST